MPPAAAVAEGAGGRPAHAQLRAGPHQDRAGDRHRRIVELRLEARAVQRDEHVPLECELRAREGDLERRLVAVVAHERVRHDVRYAVHRAAGHDGEVLHAGTAEVLDAREHARAQHAYRHQAPARAAPTRRRSRPPTPCARTSPRRSARTRRGRRPGARSPLARRVEHGERRAPDHVPAAGRGERVHRRLARRDGHRSRVEPRARRRAARHGKPRVEPADVGEAGGEAHHQHAMPRGDVQPHDLVRRQAGGRRDVGEIGREGRVVADGDGDRRAFVGCIGAGGVVQRGQQQVVKAGAQRLRLAGRQRGEVHRDGRDRADDVGDAVHLRGPDHRRDALRALVRGEVDRVGELQHDGGVADRQDARRERLRTRAGGHRHSVARFAARAAQAGAVTPAPAAGAAASRARRVSGATSHSGSSNSPITVISQCCACRSRIARTVASRRSSFASRCAFESHVAIASSVSGAPILRCSTVPRAPGVRWMMVLASIHAAAYSSTVYPGFTRTSKMNFMSAPVRRAPDPRECARAPAAGRGYSTTASARATSAGGSETPRRRAVPALRTSSKRVASSTGRSCGRAPRRILSTWAAARRAAQARSGA